MQSPDAQRNRAKILVWWTVWASVLSGLTIIYLVCGRMRPLPANLPVDKILTGLVGVVPLFVSVVIRWLVLPRYSEMNRAFVMFVIGLLLAEVGGVLGVFLGGPYRDDLFALGIFGVVQFIPIFAKNYVEPKGSGFIPNN